MSDGVAFINISIIIPHTEKRINQPRSTKNLARYGRSDEKQSSSCPVCMFFLLSLYAGVSQKKGKSREIHKSECTEKEGKHGQCAENKKNVNSCRDYQLTGIAFFGILVLYYCRVWFPYRWIMGNCWYSCGRYAGEHLAGREAHMIHIANRYKTRKGCLLIKVDLGAFKAAGLPISTSIQICDTDENTTSAPSAGNGPANEDVASVLTK